MLSDAAPVAFVATTDLTRSHAFYGGVLRLQHAETTPFANVYELRQMSLRVTLVDAVTPAGYTVLGWAVRNIGVAIDRLTSAGVVFERFDGVAQDEAGIWTSPGGARVAWFRDPDGNVLSLTEPGAG